MSFVGARVYNSSVIAVSNGTNTYLTFDSERFDTDTIHDTVSNTNRLTCNTAGKYILTASVQWDSHGSGYRFLALRVNSSIDIVRARIDPVSSADTEQIITTIFDLAVDDYVEVKAYQTSGGNLDINFGNGYSPEFSMALLGDGSPNGYNDVVDMDDFSGELTGMAGRPVIVNANEDGFVIAGTSIVVAGE